MFLVLDSIADLPGHPLFVHAAVVLVPLAGLAHLATGWRPEWRRSLALPVGLLGIAAWLSAWAANASGEPLKDRVKDAAAAVGVRARFGEHPDQGETATFWAVLLGLGLVGFAILAWLEGKRPLPRWLPPVAWAGVAAISAVAAVTMVVAGHSGAKLVWNDVGNFVSAP